MTKESFIAKFIKTKVMDLNYTWQHKKAFLRVEKELTGKNSIRGYLHDIDKLFLKLFLNKEQVHNLHRVYSRHHVNKARTDKDFEQMVIDWECARYTKPDKPYKARYWAEYFPEVKDRVEPILKKFRL